VIRLAIVDDHPAITAALLGAIERRADLEVVGTATTAGAALDLVEASWPDVVVCDLWLDGAPSGLDVLAALANGRTSGRTGGPRSGGPATAGTGAGGPTPSVLILSGFDQPSFLRAAFEGGASGYVSKAASVEEIVDAIVTVAAGGTAFPAVTLRALRDAPRRPSERELGAIRLLARGASNDEIAAGLGISVKTVESHLRRLFGRYGVLSRTELAMLAVREGWLGIDP
jgi:DNA-binding NarL/FixJ family response regulator